MLIPLEPQLLNNLNKQYLNNYMFRLKSLYIKDYKNIHEQTFDFSNNTGYIALIGLNGSGKSNLLEAISLIFDDLYNIPHTEEVQGYTITYEKGDHSYTYTTLDEHNNIIPLAKGEKVCPSSVIACYSGEDLRLWHMAYEGYYMQYFRNAIGDKTFSPTIMYINKYCWKIALISLLCSSKDVIKEFLKKVLSIADITSVDIHLDADETKRALFSDHAACRWYDNLKRLQDEDDQQLVNAKVIATTDMMTYGAPHSEAPDYIFQFLYLLSLPEKNGDKGQTVDKLITGINITIDGVSFDNLSEGEKKMILIECITQVLGDDNSLVFLDEPDAHTHIARKKDLLRLIFEFDGQTVMTTHSPMFLNKRWDGFNENNIYYMHDGKIENTEPLKHLSDLTNNEIDYFEGAFILSSKKILVVEGKYDDRYLRKAIDIFSKTDEKYKRLNEVAMFSSNGSSEVEVIYKQAFEQCIDRIEKLVFLFDYDNGGWKDGWKKIKGISASLPQIIPIFYQDDYSSANYPTIDEDVKMANNNDEEIKLKNTFMVEDLFSADAYNSIIEPVISARSHKEFRSLPYRKKGTAGAIKDYIEKNYNRLDDICYNGFKPVLDKLLEVFDLN